MNNKTYIQVRCNKCNNFFQIIAGIAAIFLTIVHFATDETKWIQHKL